MLWADLLRYQELFFLKSRQLKKYFLHTTFLYKKFLASYARWYPFYLQDLWWWCLYSFLFATKVFLPDKCMSRKRISAVFFVKFFRLLFVQILNSVLAFAAVVFLYKSFWVLWQWFWLFIIGATHISDEPWEAQWLLYVLHAWI